jgi:DNA polymerase III epsilon subunit
MDFKKNIEEFDLVFIDLETTGLNTQEDEAICEIGAYKVREEKIIDKFHTLINPKKDIPYSVYLIHKISNEDVKDAPFFEDIVEELLKFLKKTIICAYNADFDIGFLNWELKKINYPLLTFPVIDILSMAKKTLKLPKYNLKAICSFFNIEIKETHRALEDAFLALKVFFRLKSIIKEKGINKLEDYLSLYGINNEIFKAQQEKKIIFLKEAILKGYKLKIKYLSYQAGLKNRYIKPLHLFKENDNFYLLYEYEEEENPPLRINLKNLLQLEVIY